jgi:hypothetical protein
LPSANAAVHRPKPKPPPTAPISNGGVRSAGLAPSGSGAPSPWLEKRKALQVPYLTFLPICLWCVEFSPGRDSGVSTRRRLQARLKRIEAQLALLRGEGGPAVAMYPPAASKVEPVPQPFPGAYEGADRRPDMYSAPAPPKRKASDLSRHSGEVKRLKSSGGGGGVGGDGGGDQRLVPSGRLRAAYAHCERTMDFLMKDPASLYYFNAPVDYIALGAALALQTARVQWSHP